MADLDGAQTTAERQETERSLLDVFMAGIVEAQTTAKRQKTQQVWLDFLPIEVCSLIASMLPRWLKRNKRPSVPALARTSYIQRRAVVRTKGPSVLALARISNVQRRAVARTQRHVIWIDCSATTGSILNTMACWRIFLEDDIRHAQIEYVLRNDPYWSLVPYCRTTDTAFEGARGMREFLALPSIETAIIPNFPVFLEGIVAGSSLKQLELKYTRSDAGVADASTDVSHVLRACPLEELRFSCAICVKYGAHGKRQCLVEKDLDCLINGPECITLRRLHLHTCSKELRELLDVLSCFPKLEALHLERSIHEQFNASWEPKVVDRSCSLRMSTALVIHLRRLKSVAIINYGKVRRSAPLLGARLTSIKSLFTTSLEQTRKLEKCPDLASLDLVLARRAEIFFPTNLCSLRSITLTWTKEKQSSACPKLYTVDPGFLLSLVHRNKHLQELRLRGVNIPPLVLEEMLVCLGERLRSLQVPICNDYESPRSRILRLVKLVLIHNRYISDLAFGSLTLDKPLCLNFSRNERSSLLLDFGRVSDFETSCVAPVHSYKCGHRTPSAIRWIDVVTDVVKRRLPRLSCPSIEMLRWVLSNIRYLGDIIVI